ncbi:MAG: hypothetical protein LDL55_08760 [Armatimonadetes bacterium]|nr:hypothetical protein [Armatimonadota bacterium]
MAALLLLALGTWGCGQDSEQASVPEDKRVGNFAYVSPGGEKEVRKPAGAPGTQAPR